MELAINADSSWNRWHSSYEALGERCRGLGVGALELVYYPDNAGFATAPEVLADHGVRIICVNSTAKWRVMITNDLAEAQDQIMTVINLAADLGAEFVITYPGHNSDWDFEKTVDEYRTRMEPCHDLAAEKGITMLLENHFDLRNEDPEQRDVVRRPELTARFLDALDVPCVKINFDAGNVYAAGIEPWPYGYRVLRDHVAYAHLKGMARYSEDLYGSSEDFESLSDAHAGVFVPVAVGDCGINYWGLLKEMTQDGNVKFATFEDHARAEHADTIYERGIALARAAIEAGRIDSSRSFLVEA